MVGVGRTSRLRAHLTWRLGVFVWAELVLLLWWAGERPGLLSPDSVRYIRSVTVGPWTADHSVLYDTAVLASLAVQRGVGLLTLAQTVVAAAVLAYTVGSLRQIGLNSVWAALPGLVLPLMPSFGAFVVTVWKDVPFALCEVMVTATVLRILAAGSGRTRPGLLAALGAELLGLTLFRNDGFLVVLGIAVFLALALRGLRLRVLGVAAAALVGFVVAQQVVIPAVGIAPANSSLSYGIFYADVAIAYDRHPELFRPFDEALLAQVAPLPAWRAAHNCYTSDPLFAMPGFRLDRAAALHTELFALWRRVLRRSPETVLAARACRGSIAWDVLPPSPRRAHFAGATAPTPRDLYGGAKVLPPDIAAHLQQRPLWSPVGRLATYLARVFGPVALQAVEWRGATWCYLSYLALGVAALRVRRWAILGAGAAALSNQLVVLTVNPAQLYRYMIGPLLVGVVLLPLLTLAGRDLAERADD